MGKRPSCCLYLAFLIHFSAFSSLLVGYSTPNWTLVKMSTGEVRSLGLVVTCDREKCDMLHVTSARSVLVIIFGMCTFCILMSLFSIQTFCLALCNRSCKEKNFGTCLSYYSLFIAFCIAGTLGLYQIDLREEAKPDVMNMWMGWSRYCIMGAAGGFFLGAWLNVGDYLLRNRARNRELLKRTEDIKAKVAAHSMPPSHANRAGNGNSNTHRSNETRRISLAERRQQYANRDKWRAPVEKNRRSPRMCDTVESAIRHSTRNLNKDRCLKTTSDKSGIGGGEGCHNVDQRLVQIAKEHRVKSINVKEAPRINVTASSAGRDSKRATCENSVSESRKSTKREEKVEFSEAALKYRLERLHQLTFPTPINEEKRKLSAVHEEPKGNERERSRTPKEKKVLSRQETKTLVGNGLLQCAASMNIDMSCLGDVGQRNAERDNKPLRSQLSVENGVSKKTTRTRDPDSAKINENNISRHTKPHPLKRDGQISSQETSFDSSTKLRQIKKTSGSLEEQSFNSNSNRMSKDDVIPPIKREPKAENDNMKKNNNNSSSTETVSKTDSRVRENSKAVTVTASSSKSLGESLDEPRPKNSMASQDSTVSGEMTEEQIKRRQIVESMLLAKKNRKKKRITQ